MNTERWTHIQTLFMEALEHAPEERDAFLATACDDVAIRAEVEALLTAADEAESYFNDLAVRAGLPSFDAAASTGLEGKRVGAYRLLRLLGRGGMGAVYLAERADDQFQKRVAIKLLPFGMETDDAQQRFLAERQILARLEHPSVARLYDGGVTDDGRPYFVMEYVEGTPIDAYCDQHHLAIPQRIRLFQQVCAAVQYAHQNLIIHRDLKPANILVTAAGQVKLLDFGIAKLIDADEPRTHAHMMTLAYASPEQVCSAPVTTATDVYALGVILYELLAGCRPYRLDDLVPSDVERTICQAPPPPPSAALARSQGLSPGQSTAPAISRARGTTPSQLRKQLAGDLDAVVLKALRKEPERRHPSVEQMADDLDRYLNHLPVKAHLDTIRYRAMCFVKRHTVGVAATAVIFLLLGAVTALSIRFALTSRAQTARITQERDKAEQVADFMVDLFESSSPFVSLDDTITARDLLKRGIERIEALDGQPAIQAHMLRAMGRVYYNLGQYERSESLLERALANQQEVYGEEHLEVAATMADLAWTLKDRGAFARADSLLQRVLAARRQWLPADDPLVATALHDLGVVYNRKGEYATALSYLQQALDLRTTRHGRDHPSVAYTLYNLAYAYHEQGEYDMAEPLYREALAIERKHLGADHPETTLTLGQLARMLMERGNYDAAEPLLRDVLAINRRVLGEKHLQTTNTLNDLGVLEVRRGHFKAAESIFRDVLALRKQHLGAVHPYVATSLNNLAYVLKEQENYVATVPLYREAVTIAENGLGPEHVNTAVLRYNLATMLHEERNYAAAERHYRRALTVLRKQLPADHVRIGDVEVGLGALLTNQSRYEEAESLLGAGYHKIEAAPGARERQKRAALQHLIELHTARAQPEKVTQYQTMLNAERAQ